MVIAKLIFLTCVYYYKNILTIIGKKSEEDLKKMDINDDSKVDILDVRLLLQTYINEDKPVEITKLDSTISLEKDGKDWSTSKVGSKYKLALKPLCLKNQTSTRIWFSTVGDGAISATSSNASIVKVEKSTTNENFYTITALKSRKCKNNI